MDAFQGFVNNQTGTTSQTMPLRSRTCIVKKTLNTMHTFHGLSILHCFMWLFGSVFQLPFMLGWVVSLRFGVYSAHFLPCSKSCHRDKKDEMDFLFGDC